MTQNKQDILVSRAGLEPATTALKVRCRLLDLQFRAQNNGLLHVRECTGLHRMFDLRYQTRYQTNTIRNWANSGSAEPRGSGFPDRMFVQNGHLLTRQVRCDEAELLDPINPSSRLF